MHYNLKYDSRFLGFESRLSNWMDVLLAVKVLVNCKTKDVGSRS